MAELALAVVPICLVAIKGINTVRKRLKTFYRYGREIKRLRKRFSAQTDIFFDECQLLLQEILDRKDAEAMVEDVNDERWTSATLEEGFRTYLRRKYRSYGETMHFGPACDHITSGKQPRDNLLELIVHSRSLHLLHVSIPSGISSGRVTCSEERPKKTRRVRFVGECSDLARHGEEAGTASTTLTSATEPHVSEEVGLNLCSTRDMCTQICSQAHHIGYFDAPDHIRHQLSPVHDRGECIVKNMLSEPAQLDRIFELPVERAISVPQQVSIALRLARSVLRLHSTPWLQPLWTLRDLSYFQTDECLATSLETLHITNELLHQRLDSVMTDANVLVQAQRECGIRNLTMHSLGVALLQIGQWNSLKPDDIADVRRIADLAGHDSRLGPRYQKIAQRCMDCDFGFGKDLAQPELQNAVYRDVVCELESLVRTLEG
ncbi:hypothetical protein TruAng_003384 [Truncatella angustata]|nr:hypothetical protein TruAng_003384 [Truncatella angustata]